MKDPKAENGHKMPLAAALRYDGETAPKVVAKGEGRIAEEIESLARRHDVPVERDQLLASVLSTVPTGEEIPRQLYLAVAEVLAFVYHLRGKTPSSIIDPPETDD